MANHMAVRDGDLPLLQGIIYNIQKKCPAVHKRASRIKVFSRLSVVMRWDVNRKKGLTSQ